MRTIPLHGKKAAGRVALVDDEDYELVSQYRWHVYEKPPRGTGRGTGPYAVAYIRKGDRRTGVQMHVLIMGRPYIDHADHDGLNNQRSNLRPATQSQNNQNQRPQRGRASQYKGVTRVKKSGLWRASIKLDGRTRRMGDFVSELEAAYAYDAAARELFGKYACPNFRDEPTQAMRDGWRAESEAWWAPVLAETHRRRSAASAAKMAQREFRTCICVICGKEYQCRSLAESLYCSNACSCKAAYRRRREAVLRHAQSGVSCDG